MLKGHDFGFARLQIDLLLATDANFSVQHAGFKQMGIDLRQDSDKTPFTVIHHCSQTATPTDPLATAGVEFAGAPNAIDGREHRQGLLLAQQLGELLLHGFALALQGFEVGHGSRNGLQLLRQQLLALLLHRRDFKRQFRVFQLGQDLAGHHPLAGSGEQLDQSTTRVAVELARQGGLHHPFDTHPIGHGRRCQHTQADTRNANGDAPCAQALVLQLGAGQQVFGELEQRQHHRREKHEPSQGHTQVQVLLGDEEDDGRHQDHPIAQAQCAVQGQQHGFCGCAGRRLHIFDPQYPALTQVLELVARALKQVGHIQVIDQHVIAIETHQRVEVEQHGGHAGHKNHVVGQGIDHAGG